MKPRCIVWAIAYFLSCVAIVAFGKHIITETVIAASTYMAGALLGPSLILRIKMAQRRRRVCDECGHPISRHGRYGCDFERGDQEIDGCLCAMGPCGCKEFKL